MAELSFTDCESDIARLVATVDDDPSRWDAITTKSVLASFLQDRFFYLNLPQALRHRIYAERPRFHQELVKACTKLGMPSSERVKQETVRRLLSDGKTAATLEEIVALDRMLAFVARHGSPPDKREVTISSRSGSAAAPVFRLPGNVVVPSLYALNREAFEELLVALDPSCDCAEASRKIFQNGDGSYYDYFVRVTKPRTIQAGKAKRRIAVRVTKPTAKFIEDRITNCGKMNGPIARYLSDERVGGFTGGPNYSEPLAPTLGNIFPDINVAA